MKIVKQEKNIMDKEQIKMKRLERNTRKSVTIMKLQRKMRKKIKILRKYKKKNIMKKEKKKI